MHCDLRTLLHNGTVLAGPNNFNALFKDGGMVLKLGKGKGASWDD